MTKGDAVDLRIRGVCKSFGGIRALTDCSFDVNEGSITGLIGPNGAGKTTLFNIISGFYRPDGGRISFKGKRIDRKASHMIARQGIGRTFQIVRVFRNMSAMDNLLCAMKAQEGEGFLSSILRTRSSLIQEGENKKRCDELMEFMNLSHRKEVMAKSLSFGQQKLLEIARVLALDAKLLMLDEPMAGINPNMRKKLIDVIYKLKAQGRTILMIEHDIATIMEICDKVVVLDFGKVIANAPPAEIRENEQVISAYLGVKR